MFHFTEGRLVLVLPSVKVPIAVSFNEVCTAIRGLVGKIAIETSFTFETVRAVEPLTESSTAVMVLVPAARLVANPLLLMVVTLGFEELHRTDAVMSWVVLSLNVPIAVNCFVLPMGIVELLGVTAIETILAAVTLREALPTTLPDAALTVVLPVPIEVARPLASMLATAEEADDQVTELKIWVLPSSKVPTAVNGWLVPSAIDALAGLTAIERRCAATTVRLVESVSDPTCAVSVVEPAPAVLASPEALMVATAGEEELHVTPLTRSWLEPSL